MEFSHIPVLFNETIEGLNINPDGIYVDGTAGGAGHSGDSKFQFHGRPSLSIDRSQFINI